MNSHATQHRDAPFTETQKAALLTLLTDEDPSVYQAVHEKIVAQGAAMGGWMQQFQLSDDPLLRRRARRIVLHFDRQAADIEFLTFCLRNGEDLDLETGVFQLAHTRYPEMNIDAYRALLDSYADELADRVIFCETAESILAEINQHLFKELGFKGNEDDYYNPENSYLNRVIDNRSGNPVSLCMIYVFVARRLHLPIAGVGLPGHFLCRFQNSREEIYINPFNQGQLLTKANCIKYLKQTCHDYQEHVLAPMSPRRIILRICTNLLQIYANIHEAEEHARMQRYILALTK